MADASDSKSDVGDYVWVQVPSPAPEFSALNYQSPGLFLLPDSPDIHTLRIKRQDHIHIDVVMVSATGTVRIRFAGK